MRDSRAITRSVRIPIDIDEKISLETEFVIYDVGKKILSSNYNSVLKDNLNNTFLMESFNFNKSKKFFLLKINNNYKCYSVNLRIY